MNSLAQHERSVRNAQVFMELGAARGPHAVIRPENLRSIIDGNNIVRPVHHPSA